METPFPAGRVRGILELMTAAAWAEVRLKPTSVADICVTLRLDRAVICAAVREFMLAAVSIKEVADPVATVTLVASYNAA